MGSEGISLALSAFCISVWNLYYARRKDRREPIRARLFRQLAELRGLHYPESPKMSKSICAGSLGGKNERRYLSHRKQYARDLCNDLENIVPARSDELARSYAE